MTTITVVGQTWEELTDAAAAYIPQYPELRDRRRWLVCHAPEGGLMATAEARGHTAYAYRIKTYPAKVPKADSDPTPYAVHRAYLAMLELGLGEQPARVRSRRGMLRLLKATFGKDVRVRWSWPAERVARVHRARVWP